MNNIEKFKNFLKENNIRNEVVAENEKIKVKKCLDLNNTKIKEIPTNLTVGGFLDLNNTPIEKLPENLTVGGFLDLNNTPIEKLSENLTVEGDLYLNNTKIKGLPTNLTVGGDLDLRNTEIKEIPANLTVGGSLDLRNTEIKEIPANLTVGGDLDLRNTEIKEIPDDLMVGGYIYGINRDNTISVKEVTKGFNKERNYIYFDGILWGNVKSIKKKEDITIYKTPLGYCVEEKGLSAHGRNLKEAIEDLTVKKLKDTDVSEIVKEIKRTGKVTRAQYRAITGACRLGTESFCRKHHIEDLDEISLEELRKILTPENYRAERFWRLIDGEE